jgi:hypothetical protein
MDRMAFVYIGFVPMFIVYMLIIYKKLRNYKSISFVACITFLIAIPGLFITVPEAGVLTGGLIYIICYAALRHVYVKIYNIEPTYNRMSWFDNEDNRRQNWLDVVVFIMPLVLSFIIPLVIVILKSKMQYK